MLRLTLIFFSASWQQRGARLLRVLMVILEYVKKNTAGIEKLQGRFGDL